MRPLHNKQIHRFGEAWNNYINSRRSNWKSDPPDLCIACLRAAARTGKSHQGANCGRYFL